MFATPHSRRQILRFLGNAPLLPLGSLASAAALTASEVAAKDRQAQRGFVSATFSGMPAPSLAEPAAMASTTVGSSLQVSFSDKSRKTYRLAYQPLFSTGDLVPDGTGATVLAGGYFDINGQPILDRSMPGVERQYFSDCPDGTSLLTLERPSVAGVKGHTVFAVVQFEYTTRNLAGSHAATKSEKDASGMYGQLPSPIAVLTLDQDPATGRLSLVKYHNVDTSAVHGLWITCGASLSPWNTHLSSEEYEPDATAIAGNKQFQGFSRNLYGDPNRANPYHYGHLPEVTVNPDGTGSVKKH
jgi:uncharacterized protein